MSFAIESWDIEKGLPQNTVKSLIQSADGYIWIGTFGGLVRFDGVTFTVFNTSNTPEMKSDRVLALMEDRSQTLWIGLERGGLLSYRNGRFSAYGQYEEIKNESILRLLEDKDGAVWMQLPLTKVARLSDTSLQSFTFDPPADHRMTLVSDRSGAVFVHSLAGWRRYEQGAFIRYRGAQLRFAELSTAPWWDREGNLWSSPRSRGVESQGPSPARRFTATNGLLSPWVRVFFEDRERNVWIGSDGGLNFYDGNRLHALTKNDGLVDNTIISIMQDREGNIWLGTKTAGLMRLQKKVFATYALVEKGANNNATSICGIGGGRILYGVNCDGINVIEPTGTVRKFLTPAQLENGCVWSLYLDSRDNLWIGTWGGGVAKLPHPGTAAVQAARIPRLSTISSDAIVAIFESRDGAMWFGSKTDGLYRLFKGAVTHFSDAEGLPAGEVPAILEGRDGKMWIGTANGVFSLSNSAAPVCARETGIPPVHVRALHQDGDGVLWIGTYGSGLLRWKEGKSVSLTTKQGLYDNLVSHILEDSSGWLWMGCNQGVFSVRKEELNAVADGKSAGVTSTSFSSRHGMLSRETNGGFQPSAYQSADGRLWFPTLKGVAAVQPSAVLRNSIPPPMSIESITVDQEERSAERPLTMEPEERVITIRYTAMSLTAPEKVRFKYMLTGFDRTWSEAGKAREATYMHLPYGSYQFHVVAANNDGVWNMTGKTIPLLVKPPIYLTWWFLTVVTAGLISVGPLVYYRKTSRLKKEKTRQEEFSRQLINVQEEERKRIASELHDGIGQDLLYIKNAAVLGAKKKDVNRLTDISETAQSSIEEVRRIAFNLFPYQLERLGLKKAIESVIRKTEETGAIVFECRIEEIQGLLDQEQESSLFRIVQECLNNIVKHSGANKALVEVRRLPEALILTVGDNGKGFPVERRREESKGFGLKNIQYRVALFHGSVSYASTDEWKTVVTVTAPIRT